MLYELREYQAIPTKLPTLLKRFEDEVIPLWEEHGIRITGFWTKLIGNAADVSFSYMVAWESLAEREQKWGAFVADPRWHHIRDSSEANGALVAHLSNSILKPTSFSKLK